MRFMFSLPDPAQHPGAEIAALRAERGVTDEHLRQKGVAFSRVHRIEAGELDLPIDEPRFIGNLASALRCTVQYLLGLQRAHDDYLNRESSDIDSAADAALVEQRKRERAEVARMEEMRARRMLKASRAYRRREFAR